MGKVSRAKGLSNSVRVSYGGSRRLPTNNKTLDLMLNKSSHQSKQDRQRLRQYASELSFANRDAISEDSPMGDSNGDSNGTGEDVDGWENLPPGEEGMFMSHAGGEDQVFHEIVHTVATKKKKPDYRTRRDRPQIRTNAWRKQIGLLADGYLAWKYYGEPSESLTSGFTAQEWTLPVVDFFDRTPRMFMHIPGTTYVNETLVRHGIFSGAPDKVSLGFTARVLEAYRQLHRVCPRLSHHAFAKALCHLHQIPFHIYLVQQLSIAFDVYLDVLRHVNRRAQVALKRDTKDYDLLHVCPPCLYRTQNEPALTFSMLVAADGNQSLRLVDSAFLAGDLRPDDRALASCRWLQPEEVDLFKDEVRNVKGNKTADSNPSNGDDLEEFAWSNDQNDTPTSETPDDCVKRWRNAGPESRKKMFGLFAISGIFLIVCRHGHVLVICDMVRSGELMKYPLACVNRLLDLYGSDIGQGYDIACAFAKTLDRSLLGPKAREHRLRCIVPAFHGHSHNRGCQVNWHPMYIDGAGTEDFEECERTFKSSNDLAGVTRLSTPFHRQQQIDEHFNFHDTDKYAATGEFIYRNYRHALARIRDDYPKLQALSAHLKTSAEDYEKYLISEREYLESLKTEPEEVLQTVNYMESLAKLHSLQVESELAKADYDNLDYGIINLGWKSKDITRVKTRYRTTYNRWMATNEEVLRLEEEYQIETRWTTDSPQYREALVLMNERKYRRALDSLELLVVQRLFELTKLGMNGIGYKMREKIGRALKARCQAIRNALDEYNACAAKLNPPRPPLTWTKVMDAVYLAELDLLRDARQDIRTLKWAQPAHREAMRLHFGLKRAREELQRLNLEIRRQLTFMRDDHIDYYQVIQLLIVDNPTIAHELSMRWEYQDQINEVIFRRLQQTAGLHGFSGVFAPGVRTNPSCDSQVDSINLPSWWGIKPTTTSVDLEVDDNWEDHEDEERDVGGLIDFMDNLAV